MRRLKWLLRFSNNLASIHLASFILKLLVFFFDGRHYELNLLTCKCVHGLLIKLKQRLCKNLLRHLKKLKYSLDVVRLNLVNIILDPFLVGVAIVCVEAVLISLLHAKDHIDPESNHLPHMLRLQHFSVNSDKVMLILRPIG